MKVNFIVTFDIEDDLSYVEFRRSVESKRRYLEEDVRVRFHDQSLMVNTSVPNSQEIQGL